MPRPRTTPLQNRLEQLVQGLVDAVIEAVRAAALDELAGGVVPVRSRKSPRLPAAAPVARARSSRSPMHTKVPRAVLAAVPEPEVSGSIAITDPAAVLAFVASLEEPALQRPPVHADTLLEEPIPSPPVEEPASPLAVERREVVARPGEEVLRSAAGGVVLRRRAVR